MNADFDSIHNHHERAVFDAVQQRACDYPTVAANPALLADVACVALNRLPARYIRHVVDFAFYLTDRERLETERAVDAAVTYAFEFVAARSTASARA